eukprot:COSAG01_NODE_836_length_13206_cov_139.627375_18_plen_371_part_00
MFVQSDFAKNFWAASSYAAAAAASDDDTNATASAEWFGGQLGALGLRAVTHEFACTAGGRASGQAGSPPPPPRTGRNVYAVVRAAHSSAGAEAVVLGLPLPARGRRAAGAAVALSVVGAVLRGRYASKSVVVVGYDAHCDQDQPAAGAEVGEIIMPPGLAALEAWLRDYLQPGRLPVHGGLLREAVLLDVDGSPSKGAISHLSMAHEGYRTLMPNLDLVAAVVTQLQEQLPVRFPIRLAAVGQPVSRAFPSCTRSISTEIYLRHPCSCRHEVEDGNDARAGPQRGVGAGDHGGARGAGLLHRVGRAAAGGCRAHVGGVSAPFPSWDRSILTEIYLCHACSYHEIEDGNGAPGGGSAERPSSAGAACWPAT